MDIDLLKYSANVPNYKLSDQTKSSLQKKICGYTLIFQCFLCPPASN